MAERRSMGAALLSPEGMAFIKGGSPGTKIDPVKAPAEAPPQAVAPTVEDTLSESPAAPPSRLRKRPARSDRSRGASHEDYSPRGMRWISVTTRLLPETADALRRASLEQKLERLRPDTQQEIVEAAVRRWLSDEGYL